MEYYNTINVGESATGYKLYPLVEQHESQMMLSKDMLTVCMHACTQSHPQANYTMLYRAFAPSANLLQNQSSED